MGDIGKKINEALSEIDDKYLDAAERMKVPRKRSPWLKWGAMAAAVLLIVGAVALARQSANVPFEPYPYPYQDAPSVDGQNTQPMGEQPTPTDSGQKPPPTDVTGPDETSGEVYAQFLAARAEYPVMVQFNEEDWDARNTWRTEQYERSERYKSDPADLEAFLSALLPQLLSETDGENRVCSPLNLYMALAMAAEISGGQTRAQIADLLGIYAIYGGGIGTLRSRADTLWNANYRDDGLTTSILAGSLWMRDGFAYNKETLEQLRGNYHASSFYGDMSDPRYTEALRGWLNEQTGGQLQGAVENVTLDAQTMLELVTTVYFRAQWLSRFDAANTSPEIFHALNGDIECDFLHEDNASFWVYRGEHFTAVEQSFVDGGSMWFLLPDEGLTPEALLSDPEALSFLISGDAEQAEWYYGKLALPKLDITSELELSDTLKALGVTAAFDSAAANFSPLLGDADGVALSNIQHAARVTMDEEGVTATAFTAMDLGAGGPEFEMDFILDRPFLFKIDGSNHTPLFVGIVNEP